ncbi:hypothetical protein NL676_002372 [Syzygium grande]|nr:hypothetical protein NL676_002372 [Syzygium grande]
MDVAVVGEACGSARLTAGLDWKIVGLTSAGLDWRLDDKEESSYSSTGPSRAAAQLLRRWHQRIPVSGAADRVELRGFVIDEKALSWVTVLWPQQRQGLSLRNGGSKLLTAIGLVVNGRAKWARARGSVAMRRRFLTLAL